MVEETEKKKNDKLCLFTPDEEDRVANLLKSDRTLSELKESSDRCIKHVSEHLDRIEEEILSGAKDKKTD